MKKFLILLSLLFVTVCYAAPPPAGADLQSVQKFSVQDESVTVDVAVYTMQRIEAQEVAFNYIGNTEVFAGTANNYNEYEAILMFADMPVMYNDSRLTALNKPPSFIRNVEVKMLVALNKQHTNSAIRSPQTDATGG